jgi:hypothetical protein
MRVIQLGRLGQKCGPLAQCATLGHTRESRQSPSLPNSHL